MTYRAIIILTSSTCYSITVQKKNRRFFIDYNIVKLNTSIEIVHVFKIVLVYITRTWLTLHIIVYCKKKKKKTSKTIGKKLKTEYAFKISVGRQPLYHNSFC